MASRVTLPLLYADFPSTAPPSITVYNHGTTTPSTLYTDATATATASNPFTSDQFGDAMFFAADGDYDVAVTLGDSTDTFTVTVRGGLVIQSIAAANATLAIDSRLGLNAIVSPSVNVTTCTVTNLQVGQRFVLDFISDGTHTFAYPTVCKFAGGAKATASAVNGYRDRYTFIWDGTNLIEESRAIGIR